MFRSLRTMCLSLLFLRLFPGPVATVADDATVTYRQLREEFASPDHARWGEVPLWWWEGDRLTEERVRWQLETLAAAGVKSVCPIQRSPGRCDPQSFSAAWWDMLAFVHRECRRLGMTLWAYDQVGYGHYGWLERAAAQTGDDRTARLVFLTADGHPGQPFRLELPSGELLGARAYPVEKGVADDSRSVAIKQAAEDVENRVLRWTPPAGTWRVAVMVAVPDQTFQLSDAAADTFLDMLYGQIERRLGSKAMGDSFVGVFQDEHPPTPRDIYTDELAETFRKRFGYEITRAIPALHFDVGPLTPKYRTDFFDAYLAVDERCYWKRVYDWTRKRNLLTSHDNWGRNDLYRQSQGYIDYYRTQRWFSAPGYDDSQQAPVDRRNYYDTKIASSIARLYGRPRVWAEAFHTSGWGRTTDQTLSWLSANYAFGANLYDEHGLYYSTRASTWEHAAPDPHWRQPYWLYYRTLSDWVARVSYLMSQGTHVVDVAVHYPVVSLLAGEAPTENGPDYNVYMQLSRTIYNAGIDNDVADDDSILAGQVEDGRLLMGSNAYRALVFGPETTVRRSVLEKALLLAENGGSVLFFGQLPSASTEAGRDDPRVAELLERLLGTATTEDGASPHRASGEKVTNRLPSGGFCAFVPTQPEELPQMISAHVNRDFIGRGGHVFVNHRRIGEVDVYLVENVESEPIELVARFRVDGAPERWDPFTGKVSPVDRFERNGSFTNVTQRLEGQTAELLVFRPGGGQTGTSPSGLIQPPDLEKTLPDQWQFSVIPTRDNRWGEFRWPPSDEIIGPEIRSLRYAEETERSGIEQGWNLAEFDDAAWSVARYSIGPYWLFCQPAPGDAEAVGAVLDELEGLKAGDSFDSRGNSVEWRPVEFSKTIGLARPAPWGGHSGYPDGAIDQNFIELPKGRKLLFTRIRSPKQQRLGLRVELRNSKPRLWVGGVEQPFEGAVGNLPLREGENSVLVDLPDGGRGMLYVQAEPPSVRSMEEVARGMATPDLRAASWIWAGDTHAAYFRRRFRLEEIPEQARVVVTGYSGYRLFVNGIKIEEEIGPWANWEKPESFNIRPHLRQGENVIAAWGQVHAGQHVHGQAENRGFVLALKIRNADGSEHSLVTDGSWRGTINEQEGWERVGFDDSRWETVTVLGRMGIEPWGTRPLENVGALTEPRRKLAIDLPSPYLTCFDEVPDIRYDVKPKTARRIGWYRFTAPPGVNKLRLNTTAPARVWVNGAEAEVHGGIVDVAKVAEPPSGVSTVAIRLEMEEGAYGGAAFPRPIGLEFDGGTIRLGLWADFAMPTYSGIGVYRQTVDLSASEAQRRTVLDLGQVLVAAEVLVNGRSAGVRLARPFKFDVSDLVKTGENTIEVHVANTIAPHYTVTNEVRSLGPTDSGLLGPVVLRQELPPDEWVAWAKTRIARLRNQQDTSTPELEAAQRRWENTPGWIPLEPTSFRASPGTDLKRLPDGSLVAEPGAANEAVYSFDAETTLTGITGFRVEWFSDSHPATSASPLEITATRPGNAPFRGRYVRVQLVDRNEFLHMAEVQVFRGAKNVAPTGQASQSSSHPGAPAALAIDGNTNGSWSGRSVSHTGKQDDPWWEVDLGAVAPVNRITIFNRTDGDLENRLDRFRVSLLDESRTPVWQRLVTEPPDPSVTLHLSPAPVRLACVDPETGSRRDGAERFAWHACPRDGRRHVAVFQTGEPVGFSPRTVLNLKLTIDGQSPKAAGRFRISATTKRAPVVDVPPHIAQIKSTPPEERDKRQRSALAKFYRRIAPELRFTRERLAKLEAQLRAVE